MNLSTTYLGFTLPHPLISGAGPLADTLDSVRRVEDSGAAAIVMRSLFEEQINAEGLATHRAMETHAHSFSEALSFFPNNDEFILGPDEYLEHLRKIKKAVAIPVIASLNGTTPGGWLEYSHLIEEAGADALELHIYSVPPYHNQSGEALERRTVNMVTTVRRAIKIPLAVKLSPFHTSFANIAKQLDFAGADGLILFNRFYQADIDVQNLEVVSHLKLSDSSELPLRLRWLAILWGHVNASLAVTGGVHTAVDVIKAVMCGADGVQMVSALLKHGPAHLPKILEDLRKWLEENEYESLNQMRGSMSLINCPDPKAYLRGNYIRVLQTWQA
jgi:dihydroorotate dehydrogenase (fumarate)